MGGAIVNAEQERKELEDVIARIREQIRIIDELFPEDDPRPQREIAQRYYSQERGTP
jgi:hypothetical protein